MAIVKSAGLRNFVGKHAGNVYYIQKGVALAREKAAQVTNPKTAAQMVQRVRLANLVNFYRVNKEWMKKYSFEKLRPYLSIYNEFVAANMKNSVPLTKSDAATGVVLPAQLIVTKGTLPSIGALKVSDANQEAVSRINVGSELKTIGELSNALINIVGGWKVGDQLSAIVIGFSAGKPCAVNATEMVLDTESADDIPSPLFVLDQRVAVDIATGLGGKYYEMDNGFAVALVQSRRENGKILVSTETLSLSQKAEEVLGNATTEDAYNAAMDSYKQSEQPFLDPEQGGTKKLCTITKIVSPTEGGAILGPTIVPEGTKATMKMVPNTGYKLSYYTVDGARIDPSASEQTTGASYPMWIDKDFKIEAFFVKA